MSWGWAALLALGAVAAGFFALLAGASRREVERLKLVRAEVAEVRRHRRGAPGPA